MQVSVLHKVRKTLRKSRLPQATVLSWKRHQRVTVAKLLVDVVWPRETNQITSRMEWDALSDLFESSLASLDYRLPYDIREMAMPMSRATFRRLLNEDLEIVNVSRSELRSRLRFHDSHTERDCGTSGLPTSGSAPQSRHAVPDASYQIWGESGLGWQAIRQENGL